jgi:ABC-type polysaccharide/polyol phosphate export permease
MIPDQYRTIYDLNPVAATVISLRRIVYLAQPPVATTMLKLVGVSFSVFLIGLLVFHRVKPMFYEHI